MKDNKKQDSIFIIFNSLIYNIFFILWTILWGGGLLPLSMISKKAAYWVGYIWALVLLKALTFICKISYEIEGNENIPKTACIVAAKHESTWDTVFLLKHLYNPAFILKRELLYIPIYGMHLICLRMIHINRKHSKKSIKTISQKSTNLIPSRRKIIIFPQGTRTAPNEQKPYKSGIYAISQETNLDILPIALDSGKLWARNAFIKYPGTIKVKILPSITSKDKNKKEFMEELESNIENAYKKLSAK